MGAYLVLLKVVSNKLGKILFHFGRQGEDSNVLVLMDVATCCKLVPRDHIARLSPQMMAVSRSLLKPFSAAVGYRLQDRLCTRQCMPRKLRHFWPYVPFSRLVAHVPSEFQDQQSLGG